MNRAHLTNWKIQIDSLPVGKNLKERKSQLNIRCMGREHLPQVVMYPWKWYQPVFTVYSFSNLNKELTSLY